jgi:hypothetical protein
MMRPFDPEAQQRAFGPEGEPGDAGAIDHFAIRILMAYETMLDWAAEARAIRAPSPFERVAELAPRYLEGPVRQIHAFVERLSAQLDQALETIETREVQGEEPLVIEATLVVEIDPETSAQFHNELKRAHRKLRWGI